MHDRERDRRNRHLSRRRFLLQSSAVVGALGFLGRGAAGRRSVAPSTLVLLRLSGGNDGLSMVVPHGDDAYHRARSSTRIAARDVLRLDGYRGLHPALRSLRARYDSGHVAIVEGVGYPHADRTHFEARGVWHTADLRGRAEGEEWFGRLGASDHIARVATRPRPRVAYPPGPFGDALCSAAASIDGGGEARVLSVELGGFDTHCDQRRRHDRLMHTLDVGLEAFLRDLEGSTAGRTTTVLVFSEFGRRLAENGSRGTDHGLAGPVLVAGSRVRGGAYGEHPSLEKLDRGDPVHTTDFRSVYATLAESLLEAETPRLLGARFPRLGFLAV